MGNAHSRGTLYGVAAAALFGASAPVAKFLLPGFAPLSLAAVLYLGAGLGLTIFRLARPPAVATLSHEARLRAADVPLLLVIVVAGGVLGPVLMLIGLGRLSGVTASLLLNLEAPLTIMLAIGLFGDHLGLRESLGVGSILLGGAALAYGPVEHRIDLVGATAITGACLAWALDNNLTQRLSLRDPIALVQAKTLGAGTFAFIVARLFRLPFASYGVTAVALIVGAFSYGVSVVLDTHALRLLGAAREAALFATAPFVGALVAMPLLGERPRVADVAGAAAMLLGVLVLARERHAHLHVHEPMEHDHVHVHDVHHGHAHAGAVTEPHAHPHVHAPLMHDHPHVPDHHHRHRHVRADDASDRGGRRF